MSIDTLIDGSPASIRRVADWLRQDFGDAADDMASGVWRQRSRASADWTGQAGDAFAARAQRLGRAGDRISASAGEAADVPEKLAATLERVQRRMKRIRAEARAAHLPVAGYVIQPPDSCPAPPGPAPAPEASGAEKRAHGDAEAAVAEHKAQMRAYRKAETDARAARTDWTTAVTSASTVMQRYDKELVGVVGDFTAGAAALGAARAAVGARRQALRSGAYGALLRDRALRLQEVATGTPASRRAMERTLAGIGAADEARLRAGVRADLLDERGGIGRAARSAGPALGVLGAGYGVKEDLERGESTEQAVASNGGGLLAGIGAGALAGSVVPGPGNVTGAVVGFVAGVVTSSLASGVIDSLYENGADVVEALRGGGTEILGTGKAVLDGGAGAAKGLWDAVT